MSKPSNYIIMSVDDEPVVHRMLGTMLPECGLPVSLAGSALGGEEALVTAADLKPDICILDIHMGGMDGLELASRLVDVLGYRPQIIYLTAYDRFEYAQKAIKLGATEYVLKPIRQDDLFEALRRAVNLLQSERLREIESARAREMLQSVLGPAIPSSEPAAENRHAALVREARQYIDEHYGETISLPNVAERFSLSPSYIGSLFRQYSGVSFRAYLRAVRISRAKELMQATHLNLSEIAQRVGYEDVNYFSEAFLQETGVRPSEYRGCGRRWGK